MCKNKLLTSDIYRNVQMTCCCFPITAALKGIGMQIMTEDAGICADKRKFCTWICAPCSKASFLRLFESASKRRWTV